MILRRASTIELILFSAVVYAAIPVVLSELDPTLLSVFPAVLIGIKVLIALPLMFGGRGRRKFALCWRDREVFWLASAQALFFVLSLLFLGLSLSMLDVPVAIVIAETWPIPAALAIGLLIPEELKKLDLRELAWGGIAFIGVVLVLDLPGKLDQVSNATWTGVALALGSALAMGLSSGLKTRAVRRMENAYNINPFQSFFVLQFFFLPVLPVFLLYQFLSSGEADLNIIPLDALWASLPLVGLIVFLNFASSVLYSYASLSLTRASDGFVWFFTPAFSLLLFSLYTGQALEGHELIGLTFILASNLLLKFAGDTSPAFKSLVLSTLATGSICYFFEPAFASEGYYDAIAILSIFFVVILSEGWRQIAAHTDAEERILLKINHQLRGAPQPVQAMFEQLSQPATREAFRQQYVTARNLALDHDQGEIAHALDQLAHARNRSVQLGRFVSLAACVIATASIGLFARPDGWLTNLFITVYLPAMVFSFFILIEGHLGCKTLNFKVDPMRKSEHLVRIMAGRAPRDSVLWSLALCSFIILTYAYALAEKEPGCVADRADCVQVDRGN